MSDVIILVILFFGPTIAGVIGFELDQAAKRKRRRYRYSNTEVDITWSGVYYSRRFLDIPIYIRPQNDM